MALITLLPEHVINQIAAGEVVEGPASIIKELVENSIDAKASKIFVELSSNFSKIQVIDNGGGMAAEDLELAFKKHATSKLQEIEDVYHLLTNGFRGEALASIAAVSKVTCISKRQEDIHATKLYVENSQQSLSPTGSNVGTNILVEDLFFNIPARLKFLKSNQKEKNTIIDLVRAFALANPQIAFELKFDSKINLQSSGSKQLKQAIAEIFDKDLIKNLSAVDFKNDELRVEGYTSSSYISRSDKRGIFTFLNGRILQCYVMRSAIEAVYKEILGPGKYPITVINLTIPTEMVDVNVHPNKKEVRYQNTNKIYTLVGDAIAKAISDFFYQSNQSFQPSLKDFSFQAESNTEKAEPEITNTIPELRKQASFSFQDRLAENASPRPSYKPGDELDLSSTNANSRKFIARFGSIDIFLVDSLTPVDLITAQGNKTVFDLAIKNEYACKTLIMRGEFVGESWLKDSYLMFLHDIGNKILDREIQHVNFKIDKSNNSSKRIKPEKSILEKVWQRDNYTCVYCAKSLLHPDLIKAKLQEADDPQQLNEHLASYDHHLPASKYPQLNLEERNLYAVCQQCNKAKSDSLASKTWEPQIKNSWQGITEKNPKTIAGIEFYQAN